ncbi:MAG TPA: glycosyltransferase family 4 protein [Anaerolineales bacterium]|nr:glycosyltransferase family 4 protein [Anaerolineales bacterium]
MEKIVIYAPNYDSFGGIARYTRTLTRALNELDYFVDVISLHDTLFQNYPNLRVIPCQSNRLTMLYWGIRHSITQQPAFIWATHPNFASFLLLSRVFSMRSKTLATIHGIDAWHTLSPIRAWALSNLHHIFSDSAYTFHEFIKQNPQIKAPTSVLPLCLDKNLANNNSSRLNENRTRIKFLSVSRLSKSENYKGHRSVLNALSVLKDKYPNIAYQIVGDGDQRHELEIYARTLELDAHVQFLGNVSDTTLAEIYQQSDIFILPSTGEGFGLVFLEAMFYQLPIIAANSTATPEVVVNGETGFLVNPSNLQEIINSCEILIEQPLLRQQFGQAGLERLNTYFLFDTFVQNLKLGLSKYPE